MVVGQSHIKGGTFVPPKNDSPLVIHADAPEARQAATELLKAVCRWGAEILDIAGGVQEIEFSYGSWPYVGGKATNPGGRVPVKEILRGIVAEACDHRQTVSLSRYPCNEEFHRGSPTRHPPCTFSDGDDNGQRAWT